MTVQKVSSRGTEACPTGEVLLAAGKAMAMRLWQDEEPQEKAPHRSPYETLGYVVKGRAELTIDGATVELTAGDSYLVPANAEHTYRILETFSAVECTSPPAIRGSLTDSTPAAFVRYPFLHAAVGVPSGHRPDRMLTLRLARPVPPC